MSRYTRTSKTVWLLPEEKLNEIAVGIFAMQFGQSYEDMRAEGWKVDGRLAFAPVHPEEDKYGYKPDTDYAVICTEGVGWRRQPDMRISIPIKTGWVGGNDVDISAALLKQLAYEHGETVDLAEHIREFGERLQSNWAMWDRACIDVTTLTETSTEEVA